MGMDGAVVYTWGVPRAGREAAALEAFADSMTFWDKRIADSAATASIPVILPRSGGLWIITGDLDRLREATDSDEHARITIKASAAVEGFTAEIGLAGDTLQTRMGLYGKTLGELGYL